MNKVFFDRPTFNIVVLSLLSFVEALQILIIVALVFSFIPIPVPPLVQNFFPLTQYDVRLERESFYYHVWIFAALALQGLLMFLNRRRLEENDLWRRWLPYICTMSGMIIIQIFAVFKIFLWGNPWWARNLLYIALGLGVLARIFWPELWRFMLWAWKLPASLKMPRGGYWVMDAGVLLILTVMIFAPDLNGVLARMFSYDKFYHFDSFIMCPAWAHHNGLVLNLDVTSEYSLFISIVFDGLMKIMGGFSYAHAVGIMIGASAVYYFLLYGLWRYWTKSFWLSFFAVVLSIKLQFFHWGVVPLIWIYPSATPLRFLPDVFFLFFILRFTQHFSLRWLYAAAVISGLALAWIADVGAYVYGTLLLAAGACVYQKGTKIIPKLVAVAILPWCIAGGILSIFYGGLLANGNFWHRAFEFAAFFLQGWGALPITEGLKDKQFFAFCMGFIIPTAYLGTLLYSAGVFLFQKSRTHLFMAFVSFYGLGLYHYFVHRSGVTSYYAVVIPGIFVLLFWTQASLKLCTGNWQKALKLFLCAWALVALMTSYLFTYYPNVLNLSGYDWSVEKKFYTQSFDFSQDAGLIDALTTPHEAVPLISSFENKILMQANRRPFFYYYPFMESEHMQGDKQRNFYPHTYASLEFTLRQLREGRPSHVFIQTRLFEGAEGQNYEDSHGGFKQLTAYLRAHYQFQARGQYLTALKLE